MNVNRNTQNKIYKLKIRTFCEINIASTSVSGLKMTPFNHVKLTIDATVFIAALEQPSQIWKQQIAKKTIVTTIMHIWAND